jgi:Sec-independent protein translocase protein TatA
MDFLGIGLPELVFILIIILLVVGPKDMQRTAREVGHWLNRLNTSDNFKVLQRASEELRNLPQRLVEEARLEEMGELKKTAEELKDLGQEVSMRPPNADPYRAWKQPAPGASPPATTASPEQPQPSPSDKSAA